MSRLEPGRDRSTLLYDERSLQLVVLNSCARCGTRVASPAPARRRGNTRPFRQFGCGPADLWGSCPCPTRSAPTPPDRRHHPTCASPTGRRRIAVIPGGAEVPQRRHRCRRRPGRPDGTDCARHRGAVLGREDGAVLNLCVLRQFQRRQVVEYGVNGRSVVAPDRSPCPAGHAALEPDHVGRPLRVRDRPHLDGSADRCHLRRRLDSDQRGGHGSALGLAVAVCRPLSRTTARYSSDVPGSSGLTSWNTRYGAVSSVPIEPPGAVADPRVERHLVERRAVDLAATCMRPSRLRGRRRRAERDRRRRPWNAGSAPPTRRRPPKAAGPSRVSLRSAPGSPPRAPTP